MVILLAVFFCDHRRTPTAATMADWATAEEGTKPRKGSVISSQFTTLGGGADTADGREARTRNDGKRKRKAVIEGHVYIRLYDTLTSLKVTSQSHHNIPIAINKRDAQKLKAEPEHGREHLFEGGNSGRSVNADVTRHTSVPANLREKTGFERTTPPHSLRPSPPSTSFYRRTTRTAPDIE